MTDDGAERISRARTMLHDLGHAIVGSRAQGFTVRLINASGYCARGLPTGLAPVEHGVMTITDLLVGDLTAERLRPMVPANVIESIEPDYGEFLRRVDEKAATLPTAAAEIVAAEHAELMAGIRPEGDEERAYWWAGILTAESPQEKEALLSFCWFRARRLMTVNAALIVGLVPALIDRPIMTGDELEDAIRSLTRGA